jgi:spore maturation protein SpmA
MFRIFVLFFGLFRIRDQAGDADMFASIVSLFKKYKKIIVAKHEKIITIKDKP